MVELIVCVENFGWFPNVMNENREVKTQLCGTPPLVTLDDGYVPSIVDAHSIISHII